MWAIIVDACLWFDIFSSSEYYRDTQTHIDGIIIGIRPLPLNQARFNVVKSAAVGNGAIGRILVSIINKTKRRMYPALPIALF